MTSPRTAILSWSLLIGLAALSAVFGAWLLTQNSTLGALPIVLALAAAANAVRHLRAIAGRAPRAAGRP
jgi:zinc transporter ZupT